MTQMLIESKPYIDSLKVEEGTPKSNTRNAIQVSFC